LPKKGERVIHCLTNQILLTPLVIQKACKPSHPSTEDRFSTFDLNSVP